MALVYLVLVAAQLVLQDEVAVANRHHLRQFLQQDSLLDTFKEIFSCNTFQRFLHSNKTDWIKEFIHSIRKY